MCLPLAVWSAAQVREVSAREWAFVPLFVLFASLVEYITHRWVLHRPQPALGKLYREHAIKHHSYFTQDAIVAPSDRSLHRVFFPAWAVALGSFGSAWPAGAVIGRFWTANLGHLFVAVASGFFFFYETVHLICHLAEDHWVMRIPGIAWLREHHRQHHDKRLMGSWNFNIVIPVWDWVLRTRHPGFDRN